MEFSKPNQNIINRQNKYFSAILCITYKNKAKEIKLKKNSKLNCTGRKKNTYENSYHAVCVYQNRNYHLRLWLSNEKKKHMTVTLCNWPNKYNFSWIKFVEIKFNPPISTYLKQSRCVHSGKRSRLAELVFTLRAFDFTAIYGSDTVDYKINVRCQKKNDLRIAECHTVNDRQVILAKNSSHI